MLINGRSAAIESVGYNATRRTVTIGLPIGSLHAGDNVVVAWSGLRDRNGGDVSGQTAPLVVR